MAKTKTTYVDAKDRANLSVGDVIKMTCELNGISQAELSRRSGISPPNLNDIIRGRRPVGKIIAEKIAKALNVSPAFVLFGGEFPRKGADTGSNFESQKNLLFHALQKLKTAEKKHTEVRPAMRSAIILITRALQPNSMKELEPLVENNLLAERVSLRRTRVKHHR